jgi:hypothetical protein
VNVRRLIFGIICFATTVLLLSSAPARAVNDDGSVNGVSREYIVKAGLVVKFAQFVEWPAGAFQADDAPLVIGVVGRNPFGGVLEQTASEVVIGKHPVVVRYYTPDNVQDCHVLFIPASEDPSLGRILAQVNSKPVLSIGETDNFPWAGGIIRFFPDDRKLGFEVNVGAADSVGLKVSSKLLKLARIFKK